MFSLTSQNFITNLKSTERRQTAKQLQFEMWSGIVTFIGNWIVEMSLGCTKEEYLQLRSKLIHRKSIASTVFDQNAVVLSRENMIILRRHCESSKLLERCEAEYENQ